MGADSDQDDLDFLTFPGSTMAASAMPPTGGPREIRLFGNRKGIASLANILLWLHANDYRREFVSITGLPWVTTHGNLSLSVREAAEESTRREHCGEVVRLDKGEKYEWVLPEDDLRHVGLSVHHLASNPCHEYDFYPSDYEHARDAWVHVRITDVGNWIWMGKPTRSAGSVV